MALPAGVDANWLKRRYLPAVRLQTPSGLPLPQEHFEGALCVATDFVARDLGIVIDPTIVTDERYDIDWTSPPYYQQRLRQRPVQSVTSYVFRWGNGTSTFEVPSSWIHLRSKKAGQVEIIPDRVYPSPQVFIFPWIPYAQIAYTKRWPSFCQVSYAAGFSTAEEIPPMLLDSIGLWASVQVLISAGQALTRGLASQSIGQDALSQGRSFSRGGSQPYADDIRSYEARFQRNMDLLRGDYGTTMSLMVT